MKFFIFVVFTSCLLSSCGAQTLEIQSDEIVSDVPVTVENKFTEAVVITGDYLRTITLHTSKA